MFKKIKDSEEKPEVVQSYLGLLSHGNGWELQQKVKDKIVKTRVGICPTTPSGKLKKPDHKKILDFIVGEFKKPELEIVKKVGKEVCDALEMIVNESREKAMTEFN